MTAVLGANRYGKSRVRLMKVTRDATQHEVCEWTVDVWLQGDFQACFEAGDNNRVLPTDTMKNTVYSLARASSAASIEEFGRELVNHFIEENSYAELAGVSIRSTAWKHITAGAMHFPDAFTHGEDRQDTATVTKSRNGELLICSGFDGLWLLKTARSAFGGFLRDRLTTLKETQDRLFGTLAKAVWQYSAYDLEFNRERSRLYDALLQSFAEHDSLSVQQTLYAMAATALACTSEVEEITLSMPNKHCHLVDLSAFGQDNPNLIYVPTDEPHGSIEATVRRGR